MKNKKGLRGGIFYISKSYSKANNKYLTSYDPKKPTKYIIYLDRTNLHGYTMLKSLSTSGLKWLDTVNYNLDKYDNDNLRNCILEVDFEYPKELHELQNGYPFATNKLKIKREILLDYQIKTANDYNIHIRNVKKNSSLLLRQRKARASLHKPSTLFKTRIKNKKYIMYDC